MISRILLLSGFVLSGCGQGAPDEPASRTDVGPRTPAAAKNYAAFEAEWPRLSSAAVASRVHKAAEIVLGRSLPLAAFKCAAERALKNGDEWEGFPLGDRELHVKYYAQKNDLRVTNETVNQETEADFERSNALDVSAAKQVALRAFQAMAAAHLVEAEHYADLQFKVGTTDFLMGNAGSSQTRRVVTQYRFLANRQLNGIGFLNAGFSVGVHASGRISHLRLGGAEIHSAAAGAIPSVDPLQGLREVPTGKGQVFSSVFEDAGAKDRFRADYPVAKVDWSGLRYVLPDLASGPTVIEPLHVVSFANHYGNAVSRRQYVGYPVRNPSAPRVILSEPVTPNETGDPRPTASDPPPTVPEIR